MNRVQSKLLSDALKEQHKLSDWECDFIHDLAEQEYKKAEAGDELILSERQNAVLNKISTKANS